MNILFKNAKVIDVNSPSGYFNGNVGVDDTTGKIIYVGIKMPTKSYERQIDVNGNILMAGFVNAHAHTPMSLFRGIADDVSLHEWLYEKILPCENTLSANDVYWGEMLGIAEYVRCGITAVEEFYFNYKTIAKALNKSGFRARISLQPKVETDKAYSCYEDFKQNYEYLKANTNENLVSLACSAHSIYSTDEQKFYDILSFANKYNLDLGIHLAETLKEVGDCTQKNNGLTPAGYLESLGFFDRKALCAHCVHMDKDDLQILADYDASIAVNSASNIKLASGIPPIYAMLNKGINVCLGTDGVASNNICDMFREMYLSATLSKVHLYDPSVVSCGQALQMATINGAKALGIDSGEIKVGKNADIILVDINQPQYQPFDNALSALVYSGRGTDVYLTMVGGKILYQNGQYYIGEDIQTIYKEANKIRKNLNKIINKN